MVRPRIPVRNQKNAKLSTLSRESAEQRRCINCKRGGALVRRTWTQDKRIECRYCGYVPSKEALQLMLESATKQAKISDQSHYHRTVLTKIKNNSTLVVEDEHTGTSERVHQ